MIRQFRDENRAQFRNRLMACGATGLCLFALVLMPALHGYWHTGFGSVAASSLNADDDCPICNFVRQANPLFTPSELPQWQAGIVAPVSFIVSIPPVVQSTVLPPCRAPPVC